MNKPLIYLTFLIALFWSEYSLARVGMYVGSCHKADSCSESLLSDTHMKLGEMKCARIEKTTECALREARNEAQDVSKSVCLMDKQMGSANNQGDFWSDKDRCPSASYTTLCVSKDRSTFSYAKQPSQQLLKVASKEVIGGGHMQAL